jgi:hypothetical protein
MNWLKKGPELKRPNLKVPLLVVDLYWDLRERRLLPLVALIVVAIVAAPFLLSSSEHGSAPVPAASQSSGTATAGAQLTVVQTDPGLREPSKRLAHLRAKDPFQQHYTAPVVKPGTEPTAQTSTTSTATTTTTTTSESAGGSGGGEVTSVPASSGNGSPPPEHSSGGAGTDNSPITVFAFAVDLAVSKTVTKSNGEKEKSAPETRQRVLPATTLPGKKTQVITYLGISPKSKKPLFLVSPEVKALFGEAECVSGASTCQLIELEPGFPETVVYGPNDVRYKINVLKVEPVASGHFQVQRVPKRSFRK